MRHCMKINKVALMYAISICVMMTAMYTSMPSIALLGVILLLFGVIRPVLNDMY